MPQPPRGPSHPFVTPFLFQALQAYIWIESGWEKLRSSVFPSGMTKTLDAFAAKNPNGWYVDNVIRAAQQQPELFGSLVQWGELLTGIGLIASICIYLFGKGRVLHVIAASIAIASLVVGAFLCANFYFAAGWMSPSTSTLNMYLFWTQLVILGGWVTAFIKLVQPRPRTK